MREPPNVGTSMLRSWVRNPFVRALGILAVALIGGLVLRSRLKPIDVVMVFLLAVVLVAARLGRGPALMSVALATLLFDFFFVPPYGTLSVLDGSYWFTFGAMFVVAMIMTELTATIREQALD